jgi:hypothetical protein
MACIVATYRDVFSPIQSVLSAIVVGCAAAAWGTSYDLESFFADIPADVTCTMNATGSLLAVAFGASELLKFLLAMMVRVPTTPFICGSKSLQLTAVLGGAALNFLAVLAYSVNFSGAGLDPACENYDFGEFGLFQDDIFNRRLFDGSTAEACVLRSIDDVSAFKARCVDAGGDKEFDCDYEQPVSSFACVPNQTPNG